MKKVMLSKIAIVFSVLLVLSSCKKDKEVTPDDTSSSSSEAEASKFTNHLLKGRWKPSDGGFFLCDNKKDDYVFSTTIASIFGCDDSDDPFKLEYTFSSDGKVFNLESLASDTKDAYTVVEFTETSFKANRKKDGVKFYLTKK